jgi:hypothetical protein
MSSVAVKNKMREWRNDWNLFIKEVLKADLDKEQKAIVDAVQHNKMVAVASGTARGKDFVAACCAMCFLYLTPTFDKEGNLVGNTKVAMTAPTDRQVGNIMVPEIRRLFKHAKVLPGRFVAHDIRTDYEEWFLTGFKAGDDNTEAWSGFHAVNTMFVVTEASGISETVYNAIEGNLQGNSRILLVFNPNINMGYAARAMTQARFKHFRLNSLDAENVVEKRIVHPGQVDYDWVKDKVENWCEPIQQTDFDEGLGDFTWEGKFYRPNDLFRVKVLGLFPKVSEDVLIPYEWIERANLRWKQKVESGYKPRTQALVGMDVAGMGRDSSVLCPRYRNFVSKFDVHQSGGKADHMHVAGMGANYLRAHKKTLLFIDTIGEGAGVYSRLEELGFDERIYSAKNSESAKGLHDVTGEYTFANMRAYLMWCVRDWLNPKNGFNACLPPCDQFAEEATSTKWKFLSSGSIIIEPKEDIKAKIGRSPDYMDALAYTFYPNYNNLDAKAILNKVL